MRKLLTLSMAALTCATLLVSSCGQDDDDNNTTTTTTGSTTGGTTDPDFFLRFNDGPAQNLTIGSCANDSFVIFSEVINFTKIEGIASASNLTRLECQFFYNKLSGQTEATVGPYSTTGTQDSLAAGRVYITGFDPATNKVFVVTGGQRNAVTLTKVDGKFRLSFNNLNAAFRVVTEFEPDETRRISGRNACR